MNLIFNKNKINFNNEKLLKLPIQKIAIASDATTSQLAAVTVCQTKLEFGYQEIIKRKEGNILENELAAALIGMGLAAPLRKDRHQHYLHLLIDNRAVIAFINRGRAKWSWSFHKQARMQMILETLKLYFCKTTASFIPTAVNPADAPCRRRYFVSPG